MRFLTDQDVYAATSRFLGELGHEVITAALCGMAAASDVELLRRAQAMQAILVTRDRNFGALIFLGEHGAGVIYLRSAPGQTAAIHEELRRVLQLHSESELREFLVVVEPGGHRIRRPKSGPREQGTP